MSYLAAPPETPIEIDGGVEYNYVIAQQGAIAIAVTPDADFTFSVTMGEPAVLTLTFTGTVLATPQYKTITISLTAPDGTVQTHTPQFMILGTFYAQRVPNITTGKSRHVAPDQTVAIQIATDISVSSFSASGLPAGMTLNTATGLISGTAPSTSGFYVITFVAAVGSTDIVGHYSRYFVLIVGTGGIGTVLPPITATTSTLGVLYDGDYTVAQLAGPPDFIIPFATDPKPYGYKLKYWQFLNNFTEPALGEPGPLGGGYVGGSPGTFKSVGGGVIEFEREYARVPDSRSEFESYVYDYHAVYFDWFAWPNSCREGSPLLLHSRIQFDYFATSDPNSIDLPRAPHYLSTCIGLVKIGEPPSVSTPSGTEVQAEDATFKIWKPGIYERRMRFIKWIATIDLVLAGGG